MPRWRAIGGDRVLLQFSRGLLLFPVMSDYEEDAWSKY